MKKLLLLCVMITLSVLSTSAQQGNFPAGSLTVQQSGSTLGSANVLNCTTGMNCTFSGGVFTLTSTGTGSGTLTSVNGGSALATLNINGTTPVADANFLNCTAKIATSDMVIECPAATGSTLGLITLATDLGGTAANPQVVGLESIALPTLAASTGFLYDNAGTLSLSTSAAILTSGTIPNARISALPLANLATQAADTIVMNASGSSAAPTAVAAPSGGTNGCAGTTNAATYNTTTHAWGCNTISGGSATGSHITAIPSSDTLSAAGTFATTLSIPSTSLAVGSTIKITAHGNDITGAAGSPTFQMKVNTTETSGICPTTTNTSPAASATNPWELTCTIQINTTGSSGTAIAWGNVILQPVGSVSSVKEFINASTVTFNSTGTTVSISIVSTPVTGESYNLQSIVADILY